MKNKIISSSFFYTTLLIIAVMVSVIWFLFALKISGTIPDELNTFDLKKVAWVPLINYRIEQGRDVLRYGIYCYFSLYFYIALFFSVFVIFIRYGHAEIFGKGGAHNIALQRRRFIIFMIMAIASFIAPFYLTKSFTYNEEASSLISLSISDISLTWVQAIFTACLIINIRN